MIVIFYYVKRQSEIRREKRTDWKESRDMRNEAPARAPGRLMQGLQRLNRFFEAMEYSETDDLRERVRRLEGEVVALRAESEARRPLPAIIEFVRAA